MKLFGVEHRPWPTHLRGLALVIGVWLLALMMINQYMVPAEAPQGAVSYQLAGDPELATELREQWKAEGFTWGYIALYLDFVFIGLYLAFLLALTNHFLIDRPGIREQKAGRLAKLLFVAGALSDMAENALLLMALARPESPQWPLAAAMATLMKFTGLLLGAAGLLIVRAARRHPVQPEDWHPEEKNT